MRITKENKATTRAELIWDNLFTRPSAKEKRKINVLDIRKKFLTLRSTGFIVVSSGRRGRLITWVS